MIWGRGGVECEGLTKKIKYFKLFLTKWHVSLTLSTTTKETQLMVSTPLPIYILKSELEVGLSALMGGLERKPR